jgi:hypothetical protein
MALEIAVLVIIAVLVAVFAWGLIHQLIRILYFAAIALLLLLASATFFIYGDIADLRENFADSSKKIMLIDDDEVLTGFLLRDGTGFLTESQLDEFSSYLKNNENEKILGDSYKLMIFDINIISNLDNDITIADKFITKDYAISALKSENTFSMVLEKGIDENDLDISGGASNTEARSALFSIILANDILSSKNPLFFLSEFKKGNIKIYPETALFKSVRIIPLTFIKDSTKSIFGKAKEAAETFTD